MKTADLQPAKPHIFVLHPHGVLTFSAWLGFCTNALGFNKLFPGVDLRVLTVSINFKTPLFREYLLAHGICEPLPASLVSPLFLLNKRAPSSAVHFSPFVLLPSLARWPECQGGLGLRGCAGSPSPCQVM